MENKSLTKKILTILISTLLILGVVLVVTTIVIADNLEIDNTGSTWVLIVGYMWEDDAATNALWYYDLLTQYYEYEQSHVRLLTNQEGWANDWITDKGTHVFGGEHVSNPIYGEPTKNNVLESIDWLKTNSGSKDKVILFFFTHGSTNSEEYFDPDTGYQDTNLDNDIEPDGDDEVIILKYDEEHPQQRNNLADGELAELLKDVYSKEMIIFIGSCFSGGFIWDLERELSASTNLRVIAGVDEDNADIANKVVDWAHKFPYPDRWQDDFGRVLWYVSGMKLTSNGLEATPNLNIAIEKTWLDFPDCTLPELDNLANHMAYVVPGPNGEFDYYSMCGGRSELKDTTVYLNDNQDLFSFTFSSNESSVKEEIIENKTEAVEHNLGMFDKVLSFFEMFKSWLGNFFVSLGIILLRIE